MALGLVLGTVLTSPARQLLVSVVTFVVFGCIIVLNPYYGLLLWLVLYPLIETRVNIPLGAGIPDLSPTRFVLAGLSITLLAQASIGKIRLLRLQALDVWGLLAVAGIGLSSQASSDRLFALQSVLDSYAAPMLLYFIVRTLVSNGSPPTRFFDALLVIAGYSACFALYEQLTGQILLGPRSGVLTEYAPGIRVLRSLWGSNAMYGAVFAMALPVVIERFVARPSLPRRVAYAGLGTMILVGLFLTFQRTAWIASLVSLAVLIVLLPTARRLIAVLLIAASLLLAIYWDEVRDSNLVEARVTYKLDTFNGRTERWQQAVALWRQQPWFGHGYRRFDQLASYQAVENHYLHLLVSGGLAAFVPFVAFLLLTVRHWVDLFANAHRIPGLRLDRPMLVVFLAMFATYLIRAITASQTTPANLIFFLLVGVVIGSQLEVLARHQARRRRPGRRPAPTASPAA
jgi:O-antigen ligase